MLCTAFHHMFYNKSSVVLRLLYCLLALLRQPCLLALVPILEPLLASLRIQRQMFYTYHPNRNYDSTKTKKQQAIKRNVPRPVFLAGTVFSTTTLFGPYCSLSKACRIILSNSCHDPITLLKWLALLFIL